MPKKEKSEKTVTGSSRTTTGNIRTVRLNTYRERKNEALQLELENEQESFVIDIKLCFNFAGQTADGSLNFKFR